MAETQADNQPIDKGFSDPFEFMQTIIGEIKEIPELPSEKPKDTSFIKNVDFPEEGGIFTYMDGHEEPFRGFPFHEFVDKVDTLKKIGRGMLSSLFHSIKRRNRAELLLLALVPWVFEALAIGGLYAANRIVSRFRFKPEKYSRCIRELHRVMTRGGEVGLMLRDLVCMTLENDNAYRFRFQDLIVEMDKEAIRKSPSKEIVRLLTLMQSREKNVDVSDTWTLLKTFLPMYLFVNRTLKRDIVQTLCALNIDQVALTKEDKWFCYPRTDYHFGFMNNPNEQDRTIIARYEAKKTRDEEVQKVREESTKAHEELFTRHQTELVITPERNQEIVRMDQELQHSLNEEARALYAQRQIQNRQKLLSPDELEVLQRHLREIADMDEHYNQKLQVL